MSRAANQRIPKSERGAAMLAALCLAMVFAISLSSYIALCYTSLRMSSRNLMSSHAVELAEAGLEQALYAINYGDWIHPSWNTSSGTQSIEIAGFSFENGATGKIDISVSGYLTNSPLISSEATVTLSDGTVLKRQLQTQGFLAPTFVNAVGATGGRIRFMNGGAVDSYDSSLGTYGSVSQTPKVSYSAILLSELNSSSPPEINLGTTQVQGYVIGETSNLVSYSGGAEIVGPNTPTGTLIDTSRIITEIQPSQPQYSEYIPTNGTSIPINLTGNQTAVLGSPTATSPAVYNVVGDLSLSSNAVLSINGPVVLVVNGNISISDSAYISIANTNPTTGGGPNVSLEMHLASNSGNMNIDGGGIVNNTLSPERLLVVGTSNQNGALEMGTSQPFYGVIDFPNNSNTVIINNNPSIYGALIAGSITFNGTPNLHYDVHLQSGVPLVSGSPSFLGPIFDAFSATNAPQPFYSVSQVVEVAAQ